MMETIRIEPLVSVIIPVYNGERFINAAIDSIIIQTYRNWELIIVDDGSSDGSPAICEGRAASEARIKVFHQPNRGVNMARAKGVDNASGDFLVFLDADDTLTADALERGIGLMTGDVKIVAEGKGAYELSNEEYSVELLKGVIPPGVCEKMYSTDLFKKCDYHLDRRIVMGEDLLINLLLCLNKFKARVVSDPIYCVNMANSQSVTKNFRKTWEYEKLYFKMMEDGFVGKCKNFSNYPDVVLSVNKSRLNGMKYLMLDGNRLDYSDPEYLKLKKYFKDPAHRTGLSERLIFIIENAGLYRFVMGNYMRLMKRMRK